MAKFELVKKEVQQMLPKSPITIELVHSKLVLKWVLKLKPDADEALRIAAVAHDMERAITGITEKDCKDYTKIDAFKREHAIRSAKYISKILKKHKYEKKVIDKVKYLVENHECGVDKESKILCDADSIAFFEYNIPAVLKRYGPERTRKKIRFMYKKLSPASKKLVKTMKIKSKVAAKLFKEALRL
jgi:hypothetical protein